MEFVKYVAPTGVVLFGLTRIGFFGNSMLYLKPKDRLLSNTNMFFYNRVVYRIEGSDKDTEYYSMAPVRRAMD